jgi:hypothetical protein
LLERIGSAASQMAMSVHFRQSKSSFYLNDRVEAMTNPLRSD